MDLSKFQQFLCVDMSRQLSDVCSSGARSDSKSCNSDASNSVGNSCSDNDGNSTNNSRRSDSVNELGAIHNFARTHLSTIVTVPSPVPPLAPSLDSSVPRTQRQWLLDLLNTTMISAAFNLYRSTVASSSVNSVIGSTSSSNNSADNAATAPLGLTSQWSEPMHVHLGWQNEPISQLPVVVFLTILDHFGLRTVLSDSDIRLLMLTFGSTACSHINTGVFSDSVSESAAEAVFNEDLCTPIKGLKPQCAAATTDDLEMGRGSSPTASATVLFVRWMPFLNWLNFTVSRNLPMHSHSLLYSQSHPQPRPQQFSLPQAESVRVSHETHNDSFCTPQLTMEEKLLTRTLRCLHRRHVMRAYEDIDAQKQEQLYQRTVVAQLSAEEYSTASVRTTNMEADRLLALVQLHDPVVDIETVSVPVYASLPAQIEYTTESVKEDGILRKRKRMRNMTIKEDDVYDHANDVMVELSEYDTVFAYGAALHEMQLSTQLAVDLLDNVSLDCPWGFPDKLPLMYIDRPVLLCYTGLGSAYRGDGFKREYMSKQQSELDLGVWERDYEQLKQQDDHFLDSCVWESEVTHFDAIISEELVAASTADVIRTIIITGAATAGTQLSFSQAKRMEVPIPWDPVIEREREEQEALERAELARAAEAAEARRLQEIRELCGENRN